MFGVSRRKVSSFEKRVNKLGTAQGKIDLLWNDTLLIEHKSLGKNLGNACQQAIDYFRGLKPENRQGKLSEAHFRPPKFHSAMRQQLLALCALNWGAISPAIFGAIFQIVIALDAAGRRRKLGAHHTREANILKLLKPLCLDELHAEFDKAKGHQDKLFAFHKKLQTLTFLDPACSCGNFLVIAYRELRKLELDVLRAASRFGQRIGSVFGFLQVDIDKFYGIEIEEFPAQIAQVATWLTDHQMNVLAGIEF